MFLCNAVRLKVSGSDQLKRLPPTRLFHPTFNPSAVLSERKATPMHLDISPQTIILSLLLLTSHHCLPSNAQEILQGQVARIVDGDTLILSDSTQIRFYGIDAPESAQQCNQTSGPYLCGQISKQKLKEKIASNPISCAVKSKDIYGRSVAICSLLLPQGGQPEDLNAWMVQQGWAVAYRQYSKMYVALEEEAEREGRGIWNGEFQVPAEWRRHQGGGGSEGGGDSSNTSSSSMVSPPPSSDNGDCTIKGNISSKGDKIYHTMGSPSYALTIINENKGERWFCSEDEAIDAGWRKAESSSRQSTASSSSSGDMKRKRVMRHPLGAIVLVMTMIVVNLL